MGSRVAPPAGFENARLLHGWSRERGLYVPYRARGSAELWRAVRDSYRGACFMPDGYVGQILAAASQADGPALSGTTAASILPLPALGTISAGFLKTLEKKLWIKANGRISNIVTTPGTLIIDVRFGGTIVSTSVAWQLNAVAKTNVFWTLDLVLETRVIGSVAQLLGQGLWQSESVVGSPLPAVGGAGQLAWQPATPAVGTAFDATAAQKVDMFGKFSLTGNALTVHSYQLLSPN